MKDLTVKEYADVERVHERTVRRWIMLGLVPVRRTPGGGVRVVSMRSADGPRASNVVVLLPSGPSATE